MQLWPVELVLWLGPPGACTPTEDSPPPSPLTAAQTDLDAPTVVRARHTRMLIVAGQCLDCRHVVTPRTCTAYPDGIPLAIASSRHDHREPFAGDDGVRFERSTDEGLSVRGLYAILANDPGRALAPEDAPADGPAAREVDVFGDDTNAPERFDRDVARGRASERLTNLVHEAGGPTACTPDDLCRWLTQAYPVTRALLDRNEKGGPEAWRRYIAQWHSAQLRRRRPAKVSKMET